MKCHDYFYWCLAIPLSINYWIRERHWEWTRDICHFFSKYLTSQRIQLQTAAVKPMQSLPLCRKFLLFKALQSDSDVTCWARSWNRMLNVPLPYLGTCFFSPVAQNFFPSVGICWWKHLEHFLLLSVLWERMLRFITITTYWCHFCLDLSNSREESDRSVCLI